MPGLRPLLVALFFAMGSSALAQTARGSGGQTQPSPGTYQADYTGCKTVLRSVFLHLPRSGEARKKDVFQGW